MSSKTKKAKKDNVKVKLRKGRRVFEKNIVLAEGEIRKLDDMENTLTEDKQKVLTKIEGNAKAMKDLVDTYKNKLCKNVHEMHDRNIVEIHKLKTIIKEDLERYKQDKEKCEIGLKKQDVSKPLVSEKKVLKMMSDSMDFSDFKQANVKLTKVMFEAKKIFEDDRRMKELIGGLETRIETLNEIQNQIEKVATIECPLKEVTALAWNRENDEEYWACYGAGKDLISINTEDGTRLQYITADFRIDDVTVLHDGTILTTSPDSFCIKRIENFAGDGKKRTRTIVECDIYLHGLTLSLDGAMVVACGTDTPNYAKTKPKVTTIIEFSLQGHILGRIPLQGVSGKVYRIAQNTDFNYVLTFPKEGRVYSMTSFGEVHGYLLQS